MNAKNGRRLPPHVAVDSGDGTAEGGLGKVVYGVGLAWGPSLAADWSGFSDGWTPVAKKMKKN